MDIKLKQKVKPHITADTSFHELVEIAEKRQAITHSTELYGTRISTAMQYQMLEFHQRPRIPGTTTKDTTNAVPITPPSSTR